MEQANCKDTNNPDIFFPGPGQGRISREAKKICFDCPVRKECKEYRDATGSSDGIWAGESNNRHRK